jgi:hypothetical protein
VGASLSDNRDIYRSSLPAPSRHIITRQPAASQRRTFVVQGATFQHVHVFLVSQGETLFQRAWGSVQGNQYRTRRGRCAGHSAQDGADRRTCDQDRQPLDRGLRQDADRQRALPEGFLKPGQFTQPRYIQGTKHLLRVSSKCWVGASDGPCRNRIRVGPRIEGYTSYSRTGTLRKTHTSRAFPTSGVTSQGDVWYYPQSVCLRGYERIKDGEDLQRGHQGRSLFAAGEGKEDGE